MTEPEYTNFYLEDFILEEMREKFLMNKYHEEDLDL